MLLDRRKNTEQVALLTSRLESLCNKFTKYSEEQKEFNDKVAERLSKGERLHLSVKVAVRTAFVTLSCVIAVIVSLFSNADVFIEILFEYIFRLNNE